MNIAQGPWQGRNDASEQGDTRRLFQVVKVEASGYTAGSSVLLGFASDAGVKRNKGRLGAASGPLAIRNMLAGLPAHELEQFWDAGDIACEGDALEAAQAALGDRVGQILAAGARPVVLGGGHEIAWGSFQGLAQYLSKLNAETAGGEGAKPPVLIVNMDAHFDLRTSRPGSSGTPFDQILEFCQEHQQPVTYACFGISRLGNTRGLFEHAEQLGAVYEEDTDMQERHLDERLAQLDGLLETAGHVYLTIDLDVLPAAVAPGVSAPAAYGVPLSVVEAFVARIKASGKLRLADIAEMNPVFDIDHHTARVAARLAWRLLMP
ncbi:formimidoylglutamase [Pollutimonas bauzanensis]|uniref:formimidoylglutamase n=1 Tax=Pollutimonas bauzanensis TaxID=658167 RepID=UPI003341F7D3